jgi:hypothetical protein
MGNFGHMSLFRGWVAKHLKNKKTIFSDPYFWLGISAFGWQIWQFCHVSRGWEWRKRRFCAIVVSNKAGMA